MTHEERIKVCEICTNRGMNPRVGLICKLTEERPTFINSCETFERDEAEAERLLAQRMNAEMDVNISDKTNYKRNIEIGLLLIGASIILLLFTPIIAFGAFIAGIGLYVGGLRQKKLAQEHEEKMRQGESD